jgi:ABC-type sulfate transport system permease component
VAWAAWAPLAVLPSGDVCVLTAEGVVACFASRPALPYTQSAFKSISASLAPPDVLFAQREDGTVVGCKLVALGPGEDPAGATASCAPHNDTRATLVGLANASTPVLGVVQGAYATEVLRGAIQSVPAGQIEAARAMGMSPLLVARRITLPLMLPAAIPGMANLWMIVTKDTALLAVVGFNELVQESRQAAGTTKAFFTFFMAAGVLFLCMSLVSNQIFARIEAWANKGNKRGGI